MCLMNSVYVVWVFGLRFHVLESLVLQHGLYRNIKTMHVLASNQSAMLLAPPTNSFNSVLNLRRYLKQYNLEPFGIGLIKSYK